MDQGPVGRRPARAVFDSAHRLALANERAERLLAEGDGLGLSRDGKLIGTRRAITRALHEAMARACAASTRSEPTAPNLVRVERPSGRPAYLVQVRAWPLNGPGAPEPEGVLVIIQDPDQERSDLAATLAKAFELTDAEAEVAALLMRGLAASRICAERSVTMATVRFQIRCILEKTYCSSQVEFVSLAFRTLGGLAAA